MRVLVALFVVSVLLFGCLGTGQQKQEIPDFSEDLVVENVSAYDWEIEDVNVSEIDAVFEQGNASAASPEPTVVYFYGAGCSACKSLLPWLDQEQKKHNDTIIWDVYDINTTEGWVKYLAFADAYNVSRTERYVPMAYINGKYFWGIDAVRNNLSAEIDDCAIVSCPSPFGKLASQ